MRERAYDNRMRRLCLPSRLQGACLALAACLLTPVPAAATPLPDSEARARLFDLKSSDSERVSAALGAVLAARDERFVAPLVELLRAHEIGVVGGVHRAELARALEALTGESHGADWAAWLRLVSSRDTPTPPDFAGWKGQLLSRIDPRFGELLPLGVPTRIRVEEIVWGGVRYEGIPALDRAEMITPAEAGYLTDAEPVFGLVVEGDARAYPLRILDWHEMANDVVGGVPVSLAYCTLCGAGIAYDGRAPDGRVFDFGSSGFLMRSNKLMVDRQTRSLWNQFTGRPVVGPLAAEGEDLRLRVLPSVVTSWGEWRRRHPGTKVLSLETGHERPYRPGAAYADYFASAETMFPVRPPPEVLPRKARVFGLDRDGAAVAFAADHLARERVVNHGEGDGAVVIVASGEPIRVAGRSVRSGIERSYEAGLSIRAYARGPHRFAAGDDATALRDEQGARWRVTEEGLRGPDGARLPRVPGVLSYWFAWSSYHPRSAVVGAEPPKPLARRTPAP